MTTLKLFIFDMIDMQILKLVDRQSCDLYTKIALYIIFLLLK